MTTIVAAASGNFSDTATWVGGVVPGPGDVAQTANFVVTIDADVECTLNPTVGGYFFVNTGGITINGDLVMQSTHAGGGLRCTHTVGTVTLTGTATGGAGSAAYGAFNNAAGTLTIGTATGGAGNAAYGAFNNGAGTLTVVTATGGAGTNAYGASNSAAGTLTIVTATGGAGIHAYGALNNGAGTLTIVTATGGAGNAAYGALNSAAGTLICDLSIGSNWGVGGSGAETAGVRGSGASGQVTKVKRIQFGPFGAAPVSGAVLIEPDATNSAQFRTAYGGGTLTLAESPTASDPPTPDNVRSGVVYAQGDFTGTCAVPHPNDVSYNVPVDATVGTAVLTMAAVSEAIWDAARTAHVTPGTFGATGEWSGTGGGGTAAWLV